MAGGARGAGGLHMFLMAGEATDAFVHAHAGAIISRTNLAGGERRVALIAERLALIGTHLHRTQTIQHRGKRQVDSGNVGELTAIEHG